MDITMLQIRSNVAITRSVLLRWQGQYYFDDKVSTTAMAKQVLLRWQGKYYCDGKVSTTAINIRFR